MLHLVRDFRAEAVEAAAAAMDDSAAAAGSTDVPGPMAPAEGSGADEADTEESSSDSDLPDTTAPAPRPRSVLELQMRLVRSALRPAMTSTWETSCPRLLLPTRASRLGNSLTKRVRSSGTWPGIWKVRLAWSGQRAWSPPVRVLSTAGSWSMQRSSLGGVPRAAGCRGGCGRLWRPALGECGA